METRELIAMVVIGVLIAVYLVYNTKETDRLRPRVEQKKVEKIEEEEEKATELEEPPEETKDDSKPKQKSFKQLKAAANKKKSKTGGPDPVHAAFFQSVRTKSALADFDTVQTNQWLFILAAEADSAVTAYAIRKGTDKPVVVKETLALEGGLTVTSCSLSLPKSDRTKAVDDTYTFVTAVSTADFCQTMIYMMHLKNGVLKFNPKPAKVFQNMHKYPFLKVRFSKQHLRYMITCGAKSDVTLKLWNVPGSDLEEVNTVVTKQLIHKDMSYSADTDMFAVATTTSEIKLFKLGPPVKVTAGKEIVLDKFTTLVGHKKEIVGLNLNGKLCVSIAKDN